MKNKKTKYFILFLGSIIFLTFIQLLFFGSRLDYYWNFNNSLQINNGLLPYKDINIITTPLFHFITSFFLQIFGKSIISFAILMSLFDFFFIFSLSKITNILLNNKFEGINYTSFFLSMIIMYTFYYEYNFLSCFFVLLIILFELKNKDNCYTSLILGILASLSLLSKQSIGLFTVLFVLFKPILFKENKKMILYRLFGILVPITLFIMYLLLSNTLSDFVSYCILGLKEFNNGLTILDIMKINNMFSYSIVTIIFYIVSFITITIYLYKCIKKKNSKKINIVLYYVLICFACVYPIMDMHHVIPGFLSIIPLVLLLINYHVKKYKNTIKKEYITLIKRCLISVAIIIPFIVISMYIKIYNNNNMKYTVLKDDYYSLNGMVLKKEIKEKIDKLILFEKEKNKEGYKSIILNKDAVLYHLTQNKYYKDYDLFMRGNFGKNGNSRLLDDIKNSKNTIYLIDLYDYITKDQIYNQIPFDIIEYIISNYDNLGTIDVFTIYSNDK